MGAAYLQKAFVKEVREKRLKMMEPEQPYLVYQVSLYLPHSLLLCSL